MDPLVCAAVLPSGAAVFGSLLGLLAVMAWRVQEARGAVSIRKIVIPPLGMATGSFMFVVPAFRIPWTWAGIAFLTGAVGLAYPLLLTSRLVRQGDVVMMQRSNAFFTVILALAAIRLIARGYLDTLLSMQQTGALFYLLAFGMILRWRAQMLLEYRKLTCAAMAGAPAPVSATPPAANSSRSSSC
uniref:Cytochrome c biogenesis protein CcdC n=1 Tax=Solibacter usitatus (strain Ellin6076) TaxID=234267 RepID=Q01XZ9_SOLUE